VRWTKGLLLTDHCRLKGSDVLVSRPWAWRSSTVLRPSTIEITSPLLDALAMPLVAREPCEGADRASCKQGCGSCIALLIAWEIAKPREA